MAQFEGGQEIPGTRCSVDRLIGRGGYGEVYLCEHVVLKRRTVVKVLHATLCDRDDLVQRMLLEAQTLARLQQPNIVQVTDAGMTAETPARPFLVMEYLRGETLAQVLAYPEFARGIELYYSLQIGGELADGLRAAHEHGVIHRDLKPANIFLARTREDRTQTKILDFGIAHIKAARRTTGEMFLGTPRYSAPEQLHGEPPTARTDLYSLGLVIYECLCGRGPFDDDGGQPQTANAIIRAHLKTEPPPPSKFASNVPDELERLVMAMLQKDPDKRPPTATLVAVRLREMKARIDAGANAADGNKTDPTPLDNRMLQFSADTDRGGARNPLPALEATARDRNRPSASGSEAGTPQPRLPTVTQRMSVPAEQPPTATGEPVDRTAPTPSLKPVPAAPQPTHGTQQISGRAVAALEAEADDHAASAVDHDREWRIASERVLAPPTAGTTSGVVGAVVPGLPRRRWLLPTAAASVVTAVALCAVAASTLRGGAGKAPANKIASPTPSAAAASAAPAAVAPSIETPTMASTAATPSSPESAASSSAGINDPTAIGPQTPIAKASATSTAVHSTRPPARKPTELGELKTNFR